MKKKGFTLVELLAVIAILGILVVVVMVNVLKMYRNAKEDSFITQVQSIYKAAEGRYLSDTLLQGRADVCYDNETNPFDLNGQEVKYFLKFNENGKIIYIVTKDKDYKMIAGSMDNTENIRQDDMGTSRTDKKYKSSVIEEDIVLPKCFITDLPVIKFGENDDGVYPTRGYLSNDDKLYTEDGQTELKKLEQLPKKKGHKFLGYYIPGTDTQIVDENGNIVTGNIKELDGEETLESRWEAVEYYIEFNGNGEDSGSMDMQTIMYDFETPLTLNQYKKKGSIFKGWARTASATEAEYTDGASVTNIAGSGETLTLYAVWETCVGGSYNDGSTNTCIQCPEGYACSGGINKEKCGANTYAVAGSASCTACATGYTVAEGKGVAATSCTMSVPAGKRVTTAGGAAINCAAGTYANTARTINQTQTIGCTGCTAPWTSGEGATSCPTLAINSSTVACNTTNITGKAIIYSGNCQFIDDGNGNWRIKLTSNGNLKTAANIAIDAFLVGGGGGGATGGSNTYGAGGGGGYTTTIRNITAVANTNYGITIGGGGAGSQAEGQYGGGGGTTTAFGSSAAGGGGGLSSNPSRGGSGGSGGCGGYLNDSYEAASDGANGGGSHAGSGQGRTTREFGEAGGALYSYGGGTAYVTIRTEYGSGGRVGIAMYGIYSQNGVQGIVVIRNKR